MAGSTDLLLKLLKREDMCGDQMIEELRRRSNDAFDMKAGTLLSAAAPARGARLPRDLRSGRRGGAGGKDYSLTCLPLFPSGDLAPLVDAGSVGRILSAPRGQDLSEPANRTRSTRSEAAPSQSAASA